MMMMSLQSPKRCIPAASSLLPPPPPPPPAPPKKKVRGLGGHVEVHARKCPGRGDWRGWFPFAILTLRKSGAAFCEQQFPTVDVCWRLQPTFSKFLKASCGLTEPEITKALLQSASARKPLLSQYFLEEAVNLAKNQGVAVAAAITMTIGSWVEEAGRTVTVSSTVPPQAAAQKAQALGEAGCAPGRPAFCACKPQSARERGEADRDRSVHNIHACM